jgi:hypothetical protein
MLYQSARNPPVPSGFGFGRPLAREIGEQGMAIAEGQFSAGVGNKNGILLARADEVIE